MGVLAVYSAVDQGDLQNSRARDLETGQETTLPFALSEQRFSRDGRWIAGESRDGEVVVCESRAAAAGPLTPKNDNSVTGLAWSADGTRLFFLRPTSARVFGELTSVSVEGGEAKTHGPIGPFEQRFLMSMDVSPRDEIVFALCQRARTSYGWRSCASAGASESENACSIAERRRQTGWVGQMRSRRPQVA